MTDTWDRRRVLASMAALAAAACAPPPPKTAAKSNVIAVVGAGLSGLATAYALEKEGYEVAVFEATRKPGGRIRTIRSFSNGHYVEAGATHLVGDPDLVALLAEVGVDQADGPPRAKLTRVRYANGERQTFAPGAPIPPLIPYSDEEQKLGEEGRQKKFFGAVERIDPRSFDWSKEALELDRLTAAEWMRGMGCSPGFILDMGSLGGDDPEVVSALSFCREVANIHMEIRGLGAKSRGRIAGGSDTFPTAIANKLKGGVHYDTELIALEHRADGATLVLRSAGGQQRFEAARVVLTMPFTVLRRVAVSPHFSAAKQLAIANLPMVSVTRMWLETDARFWADRGESGTAESDLHFGRVKDEAEGQPGAGGVLSAYLFGAASRWWDASDDASAIERAVDDCEKVHPGLRGHFTQGQLVRWDREPFSCGAYPVYAPGQLTNHVVPGRAAEGVVHFAGDGTSHRPGFMHGALASSKRVVDEILATRAERKG